jgi:hypothetical protein
MKEISGLHFKHDCLLILKAVNNRIVPFSCSPHESHHVERVMLLYKKHCESV